MCFLVVLVGLVVNFVLVVFFFVIFFVFCGIEIYDVYVFDVVEDYLVVEVGIEVGDII